MFKPGDKVKWNIVEPDWGYIVGRSVTNPKYWVVETEDNRLGQSRIEQGTLKGDDNGSMARRGGAGPGRAGQGPWQGKH